MNDVTLSPDDHYSQAMASIERTTDKLRRCSDAERKQLKGDLSQLQEMVTKLTSGRIEIVVFGEISTGKSALINALVGESVVEVDVQGGWTRDIWKIPWDGAGYCVPGLAESQVVLIDTPGLNEVGGDQRTDLATTAARQADLILFVTDSDLNETEHVALSNLAGTHKPILVVLNKVDQYSPEQQSRLLEVLRSERLLDLVPAAHLVATAADPREREYSIESERGDRRSEWRKPEPEIEDLKVSILSVLEKDGLALLALNAALYAADKSDRIASLRVRLRLKQANQTSLSFATIKSVAVATNRIPVLDTVGGLAVDVTMVVTLAHIYGLELSWMHARQLVRSIGKAAGFAMLAETGTHLASWAFTILTAGAGAILTAVPQGAAAGYGSFIVGQAAKYYFEHGASWGGESPKVVIRRILEETDKQSILNQMKEEIHKKLAWNRHAP